MNMSMKMKQTTYGAPAVQVLATPDHYVAIGYRHAKATSGTPGLAVLEDARYVVKAGTIYPSNDSAAVGIVLNDYDVTDGDAMLAVIVHGFIKTAALPAVPVANALAAMKQLTFVPIAGAYAIGFTDFSDLEYAAGATTAGSRTLAVTLTDGMTFRDAATTESNWTITGEATTKVSVDSIALSADKKTATFTLKTTTTALVAGTITVLAGAACLSAGLPMSAAATIATVA
jgi:hypothetical protein